MLQNKPVNLFLCLLEKDFFKNMKWNESHRRHALCMSWNKKSVRKFIRITRDNWGLHPLILNTGGWRLNTKKHNVRRRNGKYKLCPLTTFVRMQRWIVHDLNQPLSSGKKEKKAIYIPNCVSQVHILQSSQWIGWFHPLSTYCFPIDQDLSGLCSWQKLSSKLIFRQRC